MDDQLEYLEASRTLKRVHKVADRFVANLGAVAPILVFPLPAAHLGRRPGFQATVLDHKYWFARLYAIVTQEEIIEAPSTQYPTFWFHFISVFFNMYAEALEGYESGQRTASLWRSHMDGLPAHRGQAVDPRTQAAVEFSVRTGAIAHIKGDLPVALVRAYRTWRWAGEVPFAKLEHDFKTGEAPFRRAQARFYLDVNDKIASPFSPEVGQFGAALLQAVMNIQPSLPEMFRWRNEAWAEAVAQMQRTPALPPKDRPSPRAGSPYR